MKRILITIVLYLTTLLAFASPAHSEGEFQSTPGDGSSNALQDQINDQNISPNQANSDINDGDFDSSDGGLYCPNNNCEADPSDVANGF